MIDKSSLEKRVRHISYEIRYIRRKVFAITSIDQIQAIADHILKLENFRDEVESLRKSL